MNKTAIILNGSPRPRGNTAVITQWFIDALEQSNHSVKKYDLFNLKFKGCAHCNVCKKYNDAPNCALKDDFAPILDELATVEKIIITSPVYCWAVTGSTSAALDRFYALFKDELGEYKSLIAGKKIIGGFTAGGNHFDGLELCVTMMRHLSDYANTKYIGSIVAANCTTPEELLNRAQLKQELFELVKNA